MSAIVVKVSLDTPQELIPVYATDGAAGADLRSAEDGVLMPGEYKMIPTGVKIELSAGYEAQIRPRSGLAAKFGISLVNSPGTIDSDYRGEICVIMINHGKEPFNYKKGDRIAQMVVARCERCIFTTGKLEDTARGGGGFGHTGRG